MSRHRPTDTPGSGHGFSLALRATVVLGLLVDAVVHLQLAPGYQQAAPQGIGAGNLFRLEALAAAAAATYLLLRANRLSYAVGFLVAVSALGAVLVYRYVDIPAWGPLPAMYEPIWYPEKSVSAIAEALAAAAAALGFRRVTRAGQAS